LQGSMFDVEEAISFAFDTIGKHLVFFLTVTVLFFLIVIVSGIILELLSLAVYEMNNIVSIAFNIVLGIIYWVIFSILYMGYILITIKIVDGKTPDLSDIFPRYNIIIKVILAHIIFLFIGFLILSPAVMLVLFGIDTVGIPLFLAADLLFLPLFVVYVIIGTRLWFFDYYIMDQDTGVWESFSLSWMVTRGHVFDLLVLFLLSFFIFVAGIIACCVGVLYTAPVAALAVAYAYRKFSGVEEEKPPGPLEVH